MKAPIVYPWGTKKRIRDEGHTWTDICHVNEHGYCSWHYHKNCTNLFYGVSGELEIMWRQPDIPFVSKHVLRKDDELKIEAGVLHIFHAPKDAIFVELTEENDYNDIGDDITRIITNGFGEQNWNTVLEMICRT